jgi:hypothetical protein
MLEKRRQKRIPSNTKLENATSSSSKHALGKLINLQALLRHLRILQEPQRHPYKMPLDLVQLLGNLLGRDELVKDVAGLDPLGG